MIIKIFTDGACRGNPGPGGWGVLLCENGRETQLKGAVVQTTNNRMELTAAIEGLKAIERSSKVILTTDSRYVQQGVTEWLPQWKQRNWRASNNKPVKNLDLWQALDALLPQFEISWRWVKGHSGHRENEIADQLANQAIDALAVE